MKRASSARGSPARTRQNSPHFDRRLPGRNDPDLQLLRGSRNWAHTHQGRGSALRSTCRPRSPNGCAFRASAPSVHADLLCGGNALGHNRVTSADSTYAGGIAARRSVCAQRKERLAAGGAQRSPDPDRPHYVDIIKACAHIAMADQAALGRALNRYSTKAFGLPLHPASIFSPSQTSSRLRLASRPTLP